MADTYVGLIWFQSTPPHGGGLTDEVNVGGVILCFNPRPRMGATPFTLVSPAGREVSIHAPAWGATLISSSVAITILMFQSTPPHGGDPNSAFSVAPFTLFQSTPPLGGDKVGSNPASDIDSFNPRPRMGGDFRENHATTGLTVSIHAPAWGATSHKTLQCMADSVSIHAPAWGRRLCVPLMWHVSQSFNPRPRMGGDL